MELAWLAACVAFGSVIGALLGGLVMALAYAVAWSVYALLMLCWVMVRPPRGNSFIAPDWTTR